jgi:hypothetical protein
MPIETPAAIRSGGTATGVPSTPDCVTGRPATHSASNVVTMAMSANTPTAFRVLVGRCTFDKPDGCITSPTIKSRGV